MIDKGKEIRPRHNLQRSLFIPMHSLSRVQRIFFKNWSIHSTALRNNSFACFLYIIHGHSHFPFSYVPFIFTVIHNHCLFTLHVR